MEIEEEINKIRDELYKKPPYCCNKFMECKGIGYGGLGGCSMLVFQCNECGRYVES